jgi:hypothetical protein
MRSISAVPTICAAALSLTVLAGCSGESAIAPKLSTPQGHMLPLVNRVSVAAKLMSMLKIIQNTGHHFKTFDNCPATGPIVYVSDFANGVINIYQPDFAGQAPCGQLTSGLRSPQGLFVQASTHELYVANTGDYDIVVFRRGETNPTRKYVDPSGQLPSDVTVAKDGTVIATNNRRPTGHIGSISTWHKNGTFVGNFKNANGYADDFLTVQKDGTLYFVDNGRGLWVGTCPAGACGSFTITNATFNYPAGVRSADGEDLVVMDEAGMNGGDLDTFEPPKFTSPAFCALNAGFPDGFDISRLQHHLFYADSGNNVATEIDYPSCALVGSVPGNPGGFPVGVAKDYPEPLN